MRTSYVFREVPEYAIHLSSILNDSIRVLNLSRSDYDISEGSMSHTTDEVNSSFKMK